MAVIIDYDHYGRGILKIDNKIHFVENACVGEDVEVNIIKEKKNYNECTVKKYLKKSKVRNYDICPYYDQCGGCNIMHLNYDEQLRFKENKIKNIINKYLKDEFIKVQPIVQSDLKINYRNKVTLHKKNNQIGFFDKKSNNIVNIDKCLLLNDNLNDNLKNINETLVMRSNGKDILNNDKDRIICNIGNYKFYVSLNSFFQVNDNVTLKLYSKVKEYANLTKKENVLDLYCGTGTIGIFLAQDAKKVIGIEINKDAINDANENKKLNNIDNIEFICNDVSHEIKNNILNQDVIIVDPPRAGLDNLTCINLLNSKAKKIIYVSCDPMTMVRDLNILKEKYEILEITPFDMFPNTYHVECVCILKSKYYK